MGLTRSAKWYEETLDPVRRRKKVKGWQSDNKGKVGQNRKTF